MYTKVRMEFVSIMDYGDVGFAQLQHAVFHSQSEELTMRSMTSVTISEFGGMYTSVPLVTSEKDGRSQTSGVILAGW